MKKLFSICLCFILLDSSAQVRIGGMPNTADPSAILELDGEGTRGFLLPRMRKNQMLAMPAPAEGLTVYITDEECIYLRRLGSWVKVSGNGDAFTLPYANGFNVSTPVLQLVNDGTGTVIEGYHTQGGTGILGVSNSGAGIAGIASSPGAAGYFQNNAGRALVALGRVGIGTQNPVGLMHLWGGNVAGATMTIDDDTDPIIQLQKAGVSIGFVQTEDDDIRIGTNATNNTGSFIVRTHGSDRVFVDNAGHTGIGAISTGSLFHVDALNTSATAVTINDQNPTLQLQNSSVSKGFVQLNGDDIRLGTNSTNTEGSVVFRTGGLDRARIDKEGRFSIGNGYYQQSMVNIRGSNGACLTLDDDFSSATGPGINFIRSNNNNSFNPLASLYVADDDVRLITTSRGFELSNQFSNTFLRIKGNNGYTGISTYDPVTLLHVDGYRDGINIVEGEIARFQGFNPTIQVTNINNNVGFIQAAGSAFRMGTNFGNPGEFVIRMNGTNRVFVDNLGNMSIGPDMYDAPPANDYKLAVKGKIAGTEFVVRSVATWPDYVFDPSYKLMPLAEVESFIKKNKHLPNITPAAVVEKDGLQIGDMQKRMMEKIEELTLHLIEADKQIRELKAEVNQLKERK